MRTRPRVLFACVHNAGRSQMAAGYLTAIADDAIEVRSARSLPADQINPAVVAVMAEVGIDLSVETPQVLTATAVQTADVVITVGCGDTCPLFPGKRYQDWDLPDPAGQDLTTVRFIRDQIEGRTRRLIAEIVVGQPQP